MRFSYPLHPLTLLLVLSIHLVCYSSTKLGSTDSTYHHKNNPNDVIVTLQGSHSISRQINDTRSFQRWLTQEDTIRKILSVNPAIHDVKMLSPTLFKSRLTKMALPGFEIEQSLLFEISVNKTAIVLSARKGTVEQRFKGSRMLVNFFSKLTPSDVISSTVISLHIPSSSSSHSNPLNFQRNRFFANKFSASHNMKRESIFSTSIFQRKEIPNIHPRRFFEFVKNSIITTKSNTNNASSKSFNQRLLAPKVVAGTLSIHETVAVSLRLPSWLPSPKRLVVSTGSKSIQKTITKNIKLFADNILSLYQSWEEMQV